MSMTPRRAWLPLTPRGVAAFARAPLSRLLLVQSGMAVFVAAVGVAFVSRNWSPVVREAVHSLPAGAAIRSQVLQWPTNTPVRLAENRLLALAVDAGLAGGRSRVADLEITLGSNQIRAASLLGSASWPYPRGYRVSLAPMDAIPWWEAWETPLLALLGLGVIVFLLAVWTALATLYCPAVWAMALYSNRRVGLGGSWKLSGAALMPGASVVVVGLVCYGWLGMDLIRLGLVGLLHLIAGWVFLVVSPLFLPKDPQVKPVSGNPFSPGGKEGEPPAPAKENPFAAGKS
jgi:hypothetical protein